jgi:hypothetical protein
MYSAMSEKNAPPEASGMSRRDFLKNLGLATGAAIITDRHQLATGIGKLVDALATPEKVVSYPIPILVPRDNDTPTLQPQEIAGEPKHIRIVNEQQGDKVALQLLSEEPFQAEHLAPGQAIPSGKLIDTGTGIITTAEGLTQGKQEYCMFFKGENNQLIAVGYEKGLYSYDANLKEWVRLLTVDKDGKQHTANTSEATWEDLQKAKPSRMLIQDIAAGTKALASVGYRPWAAVLPSTKIPEGTQIETQPDYYAKTTEEVLESTIKENKRYFITRNGDVVDIAHVWAKSEETLNLFCQLYEQFLQKTPHPTATIEYDAAQNASFQFAVDPSSLHPETILDTTFQIMNQVTYLMEGVTQRYVQEKMPFLKPHSGMTPEDMFSNSIGIAGMLTLMQDSGNLEQIKKHLAAKTNFSQLKDMLHQQAMNRILTEYGVRANPQVDPHISLIAAYPLIPSKITEADAKTPTHIRLPGITPNNPDVKYQTTHVPVLQEDGAILMNKIDNATANFFKEII